MLNRTIKSGLSLFARPSPCRSALVQVSRSSLSVQSRFYTHQKLRVREEGDDFDENERVDDDEGEGSGGLSSLLASSSTGSSSSNSLAPTEEDDTSSLTPQQVVEQLDRFIVGQTGAKRAVAVALRNRWRRHKLGADLIEEVTPKNILMIGPTGVGKTEIARRLAKLCNAPFIKVEATKFTEVGFHGRDVDQIMRDLVRISMTHTRERLKKKNKAKVQKLVEDRILELLVGKGQLESARETFRNHLRSGELEDQSIDIDVPVPEPEPELPQGLVLQRLTMVKREEKKTMTIAAARPILQQIEEDKLVNTPDFKKEALRAVEEDGIVFLDEIDKIARSSDTHHSGADASAEGVQRDLLPLLEGTTINTKQGPVKTDHVLFICSGAFHHCKPSDLLAELQGRLPIRVELQPLTENDIYRVLTEPETNLLRQQVALMKTEGVDLVFQDDAIREIARVSAELNRSVENTGARRLHTVIERVMDEISFSAPDKAGQEIRIDANYVKEKVADLLNKTDLRKFVL